MRADEISRPIKYSVVKSALFTNYYEDNDMSLTIDSHVHV